jgi:hypothetical protein
LKITGENSNFIRSIMMRNTNWIENVFREDDLLRDVLEGILKKDLKGDDKLISWS